LAYFWASIALFVSFGYNCIFLVNFVIFITLRRKIKEEKWASLKRKGRDREAWAKKT